MIPDRVVHEDGPNGDGHHDAANANEKRNSNEPSKIFGENIRDEKVTFPKSKQKL